MVKTVIDCYRVAMVTKNRSDNVSVMKELCAQKTKCRDNIKIFLSSHFSGHNTLFYI